MSKYGHRTIHWFEAIVNKLGGEDRAEAFLRDELVISEPVCCWTTDSDGVIDFQLIGLGLTGEQWAKRLVSKGHKISKWAKDVLNSSDVSDVTSQKGKVYEIVVLPGKLFSDIERTTKNVRAEADRRGLIHDKDLPTEIGCIIRENFTNKEIKQMGFDWLVTMHGPVEDFDGDPRLLGADRNDGKSWLYAFWGNSSFQWVREGGFVFLASQVSSQN